MHQDFSSVGATLRTSLTEDQRASRTAGRYCFDLTRLTQILNQWLGGDRTKNTMEMGNTSRHNGDKGSGRVRDTT